MAPSLTRGTVMNDVSAIVEASDWCQASSRLRAGQFSSSPTAIERVYRPPLGNVPFRPGIG
jgi:hypothetical protein